MGIYKFKNIILGLGLGLALASLININVQNKHLTEDIIIKEAIKKGLVVIDPKELINKNSELVSVESINKDEINVEIIIEEKSNIFDTADLLLNKELIDNKEEFMDFMKNLNKSLQHGVFYIKKGANMEEIVNIITN